MKKLRFTILLFFLALTGCALSNEGKVDFRRTHQDLTKSSTDLQPLNAKNLTLGKESSFAIGDTLSLHLRSAFIKDFSENVITPLVSKAFTRQWAKTQGEIAIVANAFEEKNGKELNFEDMREGRVVFYSDDVNKGQVLNFDNMPIYGPLPYTGAPFAFRLTVFELDVVSAQAKAMLSTVALAGSKAYPPASPVLKILNGIGSSLFNGDQTDTEFRYAMVLDPKGGVKEINHLRLEAGNYALVRVENRETCVPWDKLALNEDEGKLYWKKNQESDQNSVPYTDNTYIIVEINKNVSDVGVELAENNFGGIQNVLQEKDNQKANEWANAHKAVMDVAIQRSQILNFSRAKEMLDYLELMPVKTEEKYERRFVSKELMTMVGNSLDDQGVTLTINQDDTKQSYALSDQQVKYVLKRVRAIAYPQLATGKDKLEFLETDKVVKAFKDVEPITGARVPVMSKETQNVILDLMAPL